MRFKVFARYTAFFAAFCVCSSLMGGTAFAKSMFPGQTDTAASLVNASSTSACKYKSSKPKIVKVAADGTLTAKKKGSAVITATQGGKKKTMKVKVLPLDTAKADKPATVSYPKIVQSSATSATLTWKKVSKAEGYVVYKKVNGSYKTIAMLSGKNKTSCTLTGLAAQSKVSCKVCAYKIVKKKIKQTVKVKGKKKTVYKKVKHIALGAKSVYVKMLVEDDNSAKANAGSIKFSRNQITIIKKGEAEATAQAVSSKEGRAVLDDTLRYFISDTSLASVSSSGTVTSKVNGKSSCKLTVMAHNGVTATIDVNIIKEFDTSSMDIVAHRGKSDTAPENTIAAFYEAARAGYKAIEFDVWEATSGDLFILHDSNLSRMYGVNIDVRDLTSDPESPNYYKNFVVTGGNNVSSYGSLYMPTFEDVVEIAATYGMGMRIHVKNCISQEALSTMLEILDRYKIQDKSVMGTSSSATLEVLSSQKSVATQFICSNSSDFEVTGSNYMANLRAAGEYAAKMGCAEITFKCDLDAPFTNELVDYLHSLGLRVGAWAVGTNKKLCLVTDVGLDDITTDEIAF